MGMTAPGAPLARAGALRVPGPAPHVTPASGGGVGRGRFAACPPLCGPASASSPLPASLGSLPATASRRALSGTSAALAGPRRRQSQRRARAPRAEAEAAGESPAPPAAPAQPASLSFFSPTARAWEDLSLDPAVCRALRSAGFVRPSTVQALSAPEQLARRDLVLRAETGSGKTLAYLVPALNDLALWSRLALAPSGAAEGDGDGGGEGAKGDDAGPGLPPSPSTLVVCANVALCAQVEEVGRTLGGELLRELEAEAADSRGQTDPSGRAAPLPTSLPPWLFVPAALRSGCAPPPSAPFLAVATPAGLHSWRESLRGLSTSGVAAWARGDPTAWTSRLVVDEADLLLSGSYGKAAEQLLEAFRVAEKRRREASWEMALGLPPGGLKRVPHSARKTLLLRGYEAARREGLAISKPQGGSAPGTRVGSAGGGENDAAAPGASMRVVGTEALVPNLLRTPLRRFVPVAFVGATIPTGSRCAAGDVILRSHPTAAWVDGPEAHRAKSGIEMRWASVESGSERAFETLRAIADGWKLAIEREGEDGDGDAKAGERDRKEGGAATGKREGRGDGSEVGGRNGSERRAASEGGGDTRGAREAAVDEATLAELPHVTLVFCRGAAAAREMDAALRETLEASGARVVLHDGGRGADGAARLAAALRGAEAPGEAGGEGRGGAEMREDGSGRAAGGGEEVRADGGGRATGGGIGVEPSSPALGAAAPSCAIPSSRVVVFSTDAAARGLDSPAIRHVIQSDFASSTVDFVHRVGRTGRAGRRGLATSLVAPQDEDLAEAIRESLARAQSLEGTFSRKRSFRKRIKKYGEFVPAGQSGAPADARR